MQPLAMASKGAGPSYGKPNPTNNWTKKGKGNQKNLEFDQPTSALREQVMEHVQLLR